MAIICPTITAENQDQYKEQMDRVQSFAHRLHIDYADGVFAPAKLVDIRGSWWPTDVMVDLHIMYKNPLPSLEPILELNPHLVIVHAESDGNFYDMASVFRAVGIKVGLAVLQETTIESVAAVLKDVDHLLIFSGSLGHFGGVADATLLHKISEAKRINPNLEIGWDGGINDDSAISLIEEGVDVLNVGGYIQKASDPQAAYATLELLVENAKQ